MALRAVHSAGSEGGHGGLKVSNVTVSTPHLGARTCHDQCPAYPRIRSSRRHRHRQEPERRAYRDSWPVPPTPVDCSEHPRRARSLHRHADRSRPAHRRWLRSNRQLSPRDRLAARLGRPFVDLSSLIDTSGFAELDDEIISALPRLETSYTGGSLKWMGVTAPWVNEDPYVDYMRVISEMSPAELVKFVKSLS